MKSIYHLEDWGNRHHPIAIDGLRILLGLFLFVRGYLFLQNISYLNWMVSTHDLVNLSPEAVNFIIFYVIFCHLTGGTLIMLGILTRWASLMQLPIIMAAILVVDDFKSELNGELWLSIICGVLLLIFLLIGSGPLSLDHYFNTSKDD